MCQEFAESLPSKSMTSNKKTQQINANNNNWLPLAFYENETKFDKLFPNLIFGKNSEDVNFRVRRKSETLGAGGDDAGDEGPVAQLVVQRLLVRPVGSFANLPEMRMIF